MKVKCVKDTGSTMFKVGETYDCVKINEGTGIYKVISKKGETLESLSELEAGCRFKITKR